jgi:glutathione S-transferase
MIKLYQFPTAFGLPNLSPFCMKVELFLRMADLEYKVIEVSNPRLGPKGKLPFIEDDGVRVADSSVIIEYLQDKHGIDIDAQLTPQQRALTLAVQRMLDEHLYWGAVYSRWFDDRNWPEYKKIFFGQIPAAISGLVTIMARRSIRAQMRGHGLGRHSADEIYRMCRRDIVALADLLDDRPYLHGDTPSLGDANIVSTTANLLKVPLPNPLREEVLGHDNLVAHCERMLAEYFPHH